MSIRRASLVAVALLGGCTAGVNAGGLPIAAGGSGGDGGAPGGSGGGGACAEGAPCDDGEPCTVNDRCHHGVCHGGDWDTCEDANPCTGDGCEQGVGCRHWHVQAECSDGNACTEDECRWGECVSARPTCDTGHPCQIGICDPAVGCSYEPRDCSDGDPCTGDLCDRRGCFHVPRENQPCEDGSLCTRNDTCHNGTCGGDPLACDDVEPCTADSCEPAIGCVYEPIPGRVCAAGTEVCGDVTDDWTMTRAGSPYRITCTTTVLPGVTLTIEPGVVLKLDAGPSEQNRGQLKISGALHALGTEAEPIIIATDRPERLGHATVAQGDLRWIRAKSVDLGVALGAGTSATIADAVLEDCHVWSSDGSLIVERSRLRRVAPPGVVGLEVAGDLLLRESEVEVPLLVALARSASIQRTTFRGRGTVRLQPRPDGATVATLDRDRFLGRDPTDSASGIAASFESGTFASVRIFATSFVDDYRRLVANRSAGSIDARGNHWGPATTDEMEREGLASDIERIEDGRDPGAHGVGVVTYSGFLPAPP